ncbi:hypothetical protein K0M31_020031 [Melipona bicolor]|uniref:Uncharacterized protein n=1 Tax=Melipona bicolor TaxID=60889 RepID=A0AA40KQC8_9HYME|nr:hypothetical protein K0M31_020031 [Melipona bicolor]
MIIPGRFSSLAEARQSDGATVGYLRLFSEKGILLQARGGRGDHEAANAPVSDTDFIREICAEGNCKKDLKTKHMVLVSIYCVGSKE